MKRAAIAKPKAKAQTAKKKTTKRTEKLYFETGFRLKRAEKEELQKKGLHVYSRRDNGKENTIEPNVGVDFMGTIITNFPINFKKTGPDAYTIYQGDTFLRDKKARQVFLVKDLLPKGKER